MLQMESIEYEAVAPSRPRDTKLILLTRGRYSGRSEASLLSYRRIGNDYLVVATNQARRAKPDWYLNLKEEPLVEIEIDDVSFYARAWTPTGRDRLHLLSTVNEMTNGLDDTVPRETAAILLSPAL